MYIKIKPFSHVYAELLRLYSLVYVTSSLNDKVNNAAITILKRACDYTAEDCSVLMGTNLESPYHLSQLAYPLLKASELGNIVFISSTAGGTSMPAISVYGACKG